MNATKAHKTLRRLFPNNYILIERNHHYEAGATVPRITHSVFIYVGQEILYSSIVNDSFAQCVVHIQNQLHIANAQRSTTESATGTNAA